MLMLHGIPTQTALCVHPVAPHVRTYVCAYAAVRRVALHCMGATAYAVGAAEPAGLTVGGRVLGHTVGTDVGGLCDSHAGAVFVRSFVRSQRSAVGLVGRSTCCDVDNGCALTNHEHAAAVTADSRAATADAIRYGFRQRGFSRAYTEGARVGGGFGRVRASFQNSTCARAHRHGQA